MSSTSARPAPVADAPSPERARSVGATRWWLLAFAVAVAVVKLVVAYRTDGTNDVRHWTAFVAGAHRFGPMDLYVGHYDAVYNHPPLIGWWLAGVDQLSSHVPWLTVRFLVRVPAVVADVLTTLLVFELLRTRRSLREATLAAVLVACSPVLFTISGFHGNTDPVFVLLALASAWLLVERRSPTAAGVAIALALSIKLVPVAALPVLLVAAWRGRYGLVRLVAGAAGVFVVLWVPVLARHWRLFLHNVVGYQGTDSADSPWGLVLLAHQLGFSRSEVAVLYGQGRFLILVVCCAVPVVLIWRRPSAAAYGVALALVLTLLLSPAFGVQYFAWALAPAYLLNLWTATAYNALAGALLVQTYTIWSKGFPWNRAVSTGLGQTSKLEWAATWVVLLATAVLGVVRIRSFATDTSATPTAAPPDGNPHDPTSEEPQPWQRTPGSVSASASSSSRTTPNPR